ncbi:MAG: hypothetical protein MUF35_08765 [Candidatus Nanopelagicales bacterium]|jgi:hypothetical protein|nr:hypothetical protein [Candidatus Nanopelagicales bacterium]
MLQSIVRFAEGEFVEEHGGIPSEVYGVVALVVLLLLLFVVTRFNPNR